MVTRCRRERQFLSTPFRKYGDVFLVDSFGDDRIILGWRGCIMPRRSPYVIALGAEERAELEARAKEYTSPYRAVVRAKIVLLASQGLGNDLIAARLDTPRQVVSK